MSSKAAQDVAGKPLLSRRILLGVSGGIAAYKSPDLVRRLRERGAEVRVVMTAGAQAFVTPLTFQAVSGEPVHDALLDQDAEAGMGHIELARWADLILVAPASANTMARLAHGLADDLLSTVCLASEASIVLAPAMNRVMWHHPATQANAKILLDRDVQLLGPGLGDQACGETGAGRMLEPIQIAEAIAGQLADAPALAGVTLMVTAGPTYEDIDPVRYLGNRSSGKMGFAIAQAACRAGARVMLVAGPVKLPTPPGVERIDVRSAQQMRQAVMSQIGEADIYVSSAAVADFRPAKALGDKIKKTEQSDQLSISLARNPDILAEVAALPDGPFTVGFAAETAQVEDYARDKLKRKRLDMICANQVGADCGFDVDENALTVIWSDGLKQLEKNNKNRIAQQLVALITTQYQQNARAAWNERSA